MKNIISFYLKLISKFPLLEIISKIIYWNNYNLFKKYSPISIKKKPIIIQFEKVIQNLKNRGINKGDILIVHSSYDSLSNSSLSPEKINDHLYELVGCEGTLVMPAIRKFQNNNSDKNYINSDFEGLTSVYDVNKSLVTSGLLPYYLMKLDSAYISRCPLNPVVAVGKYAYEMIQDNIQGDFVTPHGKNSAWKYCADRNAKVIGLGIDLVHSLTIVHVHEECHNDWPIKNWYRRRSFEIRDKNYLNKIDVFERKPIWGAYFFAEQKLKGDLLKNKILQVEYVDGLEISILSTSDLLDFISKNSSSTYPYYIPKVIKNFFEKEITK